MKERYGESVVIIGVHSSHLTCKGASRMFDNCDIITSCGSAFTRQEASKRDVVVAGNKVQIYGVTDLGKRMVIEKLESIGHRPYDGGPKDEPRPLISWQG